MAKKGKCVECKQDKNIVAKGMCGNCYAKSRKGSRAKRSAADPSDGQIRFEQLVPVIRKLIKEYARLKVKHSRVTQNFSELKMKFIIKTHEKWKRKFLQTKKEVEAVLKGAPEEVTAAAGGKDEAETVGELKLGREEA